MRYVEPWHPIRVRSLALAGCVLASGCARQGNATSGQSRGIEACVVRETSRTPLLIDGTREMYIEPTVALLSGGSILLAGRPNYLFSPGAPSEERTVSQDSVFGVILDSRGETRLVPAPIDPARIASTRAIALGGGGWAVVFAELKSPWAPPRPDTVVGLWYGEFDGRTWTALEQLPAVAGNRFDLEMGSALVRRADTLFVAAIIKSDTSIGNVAVLERHHGQWKTEIINTIAASYAELLYSDSLGLLVAVVQADRSLSEDSNSLLLYGGRPRWAILRKIIHGGSQPAYDPLFTMSPEGTVLSWWVMDREGQPPSRRARAMIGVTGTRNGRVVELDPDIVHVTPVFGYARFPIWAAEHNTPTGARELRLLADSAGHSRKLASFPSPFTGPFVATAVSASDLLVSGPLFHADSARPRLVSLLIRARVECRTSAP